MNVNIKNCNKTNKKIILEAIKFYDSILFSNKNNELTVSIHFISNYIEKSGLIAQCCCSQTHINPKYFTITIEKKQTISAIVKTLAHEITHVKQFATSKLKYRKTHKAYLWNNIKHKTIDIEYEDYLNLPWEVEANVMEIILYNLFLDYLVSNNLFSANIIASLRAE
jgi:hypothetical protein